jgi:hypothetical protein
MPKKITTKERASIHVMVDQDVIDLAAELCPQYKRSEFVRMATVAAVRQLSKTLNVNPKEESNEHESLQVA